MNSVGTYVHHHNGFDAFVLMNNGKAALLMTLNARSFVVVTLPVIRDGEMRGTNTAYFDISSWKPDHVALSDAVSKYARVTKSFSA